MTIIDSFYRGLAALGYSHPLHAPWTHVTIGLVVAAFLFGFGALLLGRPALAASARHCLVLAWFFFFPTVLLGLMDWQHFYQGAWIFPIVMKIFLAAFLLALLTLGVLLVYKGLTESRVLLAVYVLGLLTVGALGYFGGELVFGGGAPAAPGAADTASIQAGKKIFEKDCQVCHPAGGNAIMPQHPLRGTGELADLTTFLAYLRDPRLPDGSKGPMPAFPPEQISEEQASELYQYLVEAFGKPEPGERHRHGH